MRSWIIFLVLFVWGIQVSAKQITQTEARNVAINWLNQFNANVLSFDAIQSVQTITDNKTPLIFLVNFKSKGWVLVSATDEVEPVLGYSLSTNFDINNMPVQLNEWVNGLKSEIKFSLREDYQPDVQLPEKWAQAKKRILPKNELKAAMAPAVGPLLSCTWDQGRYYNEMAPADANSTVGNGHTWIGCVATAAAQVMKYWEYPMNGVGSHSYLHNDYGLLAVNFEAATYNWNAMPNKLTAENVDVQTISYHMAVAVNMDFDPYASGAYMTDAHSALVNYFKYNNTAFYAWKSDWDDQQWKNLLKDELNKSRPVLYAGYNASNSNGHAFVCDGYTNDYFHFNWGWGGKANGNFLISALNPSFGNYSYNQSAIFGVEPIKPSPISSPYFESFESSNSGHYSLMGKAVVSNSESHSGSYCIQLSDSAFSSHSKNTASIAFIAPSNGQISFWVKRKTSVISNNNQQLAVLMPEYGTNHLITFFDGDYSDNEWQNYVADISAYSGQLVRLMFIQENYDVSKEQWMFVDDIVISGTDQNLSPFLPSSPKPLNDENNVQLSPILKWSGDDPNGDFVTYSVYFGKSDNPPLVGSVFDRQYSPGKLIHSTKYYWRVVANDGQLQTNGPLWSFNTQGIPPDMAFCGVNNITATSATVCGEIVNNNQAAIYSRGICWNTFTNPTVSDNLKSSTENTNVYSCTIDGLLPFKKYYIRSYTNSSEGVAYSETASFFTRPSLPQVSSVIVGNIFRTKATVTGKVNALNDSLVINRGVVWSVHKGFNPLMANVENETGQWTTTDEFEIEVDNLPGPDTIYYRIFAENTVGLSYSLESQFITQNHIPVIDLDSNRSSGADNKNYFGKVIEQEPGGFIADVDLLVSDDDNDSIQQVKVILTKQFSNANEFLTFNESFPGLTVHGNNTDTLTLNSASIDNLQWAGIIQKIELWIGSDAPNKNLVREVELVVSDGLATSLPAKAFMNVQLVNDAPVNVVEPEILQIPVYNSLIEASNGAWEDILDEENCQMSVQHQWQLKKGNEILDIEGANSLQLLVRSEYCGHSIRIVETVFDLNCGGENTVSASISSNWANVQKAGQSISFDVIPILAYSKKPVLLKGTSTSNLPLSYSLSAKNLAHISNDTLFLDAVGRGIITSIQEGNECFHPSEQAFRILTIEEGTQEIIYTNPGILRFSDGCLPLFAESTAGLPLTLSCSDNSIAYFRNDTLFFAATGEVEITLAQTGNAYIQAAETIVVNLKIEKGEQIVTANLSSVYEYGTSPFIFDVEISSYLEPIIGFSNPSVLKLNGNTIEIIGVGECWVSITQPGNENYLAATQKDYFVEVIKGTQAINFNLDAELFYGNDIINFDVSASSQLPVSVVSSDTTILKKVDGIWTIQGVGKVNLVAENGGNDLWNAIEVEKNIEVQKGVQEIDFPVEIEKHFGDESFILPFETIKGSANYNVAIENEMVAVYTDGKIDITGVGNTSIILSENGNHLWQAFEKELTLNVRKGLQIIHFNAIDSTIFGAPAFVLSANTNSELPIQFLSTNQEVALVKGDSIYIQNSGETKLIAMQLGDENWEAALSVEHVLVVNKASQAIQTILPETLVANDLLLNSDFICTSGLNVDEFNSSNPAVISILGKELTINGVGKVIINAKQNGSRNYLATSADFNFEIINPVGIEKANHPTFAVYPNPAHERVSVTLVTSIKFPAKLKVLNTLGQLIHSQEMTKTYSSFDVSLFKEGVYFVLVEWESGSSIEKLVIK